MKKYYFLLVALIIFALLAVGVLIYRADQADTFFETYQEETLSDNN